jgi:hypothetical protein
MVEAKKPEAKKKVANANITELHMVFSTNAGEKPVPFTRDLLDIKVESRLALTKYPFFCTNYAYDIAKLELMKLDEIIGVFFNLSRFRTILLEKSVPGTDYTNQNMKITMEALFFLKGGYDQSSVKNGFVILKPALKTLSMPYDDYSYLTISGKSYTPHSFVYHDDLFNNEEYKRLVEAANLFVNQMLQTFDMESNRITELVNNIEKIYKQICDGIKANDTNSESLHSDTTTFIKEAFTLLKQLDDTEYTKCKENMLALLKDDTLVDPIKTNRKARITKLNELFSDIDTEVSQDSFVKQIVKKITKIKTDGARMVITKGSVGALDYPVNTINAINMDLERFDVDKQSAYVTFVAIMREFKPGSKYKVRRISPNSKLQTAIDICFNKDRDETDVSVKILEFSLLLNKMYDFYVNGNDTLTPEEKTKGLEMLPIGLYTVYAASRDTFSSVSSTTQGSYGEPHFYVQLIEGKVDATNRSSISCQLKGNDLGDIATEFFEPTKTNMSYYASNIQRSLISVTETKDVTSTKDKAPSATKPVSTTTRSEPTSTKPVSSAPPPTKKMDSQTFFNGLSTDSRLQSVLLTAISRLKENNEKVSVDNVFSYLKETLTRPIDIQLKNLIRSFLSGVESILQIIKPGNLRMADEKRQMATTMGELGTNVTKYIDQVNENNKKANKDQQDKNKLLVNICNLLLALIEIFKITALSREVRQLRGGSRKTKKIRSRLAKYKDGMKRRRRYTKR